MAQPNYTPIQLYHSTTAAAVPTAANLAQGELAINITDGKLYYEDGSGVVQVIASKGAGTIGGSTTQIQYNNAGALAGSSDMTYTSGTNTVLLTTLNLTNALGAVYGGTGQSTYTTGDLLYSSAANTLSKLAIGTANYILTVNSGGTNVQWSAPSSISVSTATNLAGGVAGSVPYQSGASTTTFLGIGAADRVMTSSGSAPQWVTALTGLTGVSSSSITNTSLTSTRVVYSGASGVQTNSANLTFDGATLTTAGLSNSGTSALVKLVTVGGTSFSGTTVFAPATPAKFYLGTGTVTDVTSGVSQNNTYGAIMSLGITPIAASNTGVIYENAATMYIDGAPSASTNVSFARPYALYLNSGTTTAATAVTYTNAATLYIAGAPTAGANVTLTTPYALYVNAGNVYLGGGTANGVAYLNGSKVLTTGSALTFDGATLVNSTNSNAGNYIVNRNVNTGTTATAYVISDATAAFTGYTAMGSRSSGYTTSGMLEASSGGLFSVGLTNGLNIMTLDGYPVKFGVSNVEGMRLTSTSLYTASTINVGIGTSSPSTYGKLVVSGSVASAGLEAWIQNKTDTGGDNTRYAGLSFSVGSDDGTSAIRVYRTASSTDYSTNMTFWTKGSGVGATSPTQRMVIDASGNLGIGTANPNQALSVCGSISLGVGSTAGSLTIKNADSSSSATDARLLIGNSSSTYGALRMLFNSTTAVAIDTVTWGNTGTQTNLLLNVNGGKIGMGVSSINASGGVLQLSSGITFPATQSASSDANTLDDYEEGAIDGNNLGLAYATPGTSSFTYSDRVGTYTKIGRVVYFTIDIRLSAFSKGTASGELFIVGLPFAQRVTSGFDGARCTVQLYNWTYTTSPIIAVVTSNSTTISISRMVSNSVSAVIDDPNGNSIIWVTGFYFV